MKQKFKCKFYYLLFLSGNIYINTVPADCQYIESVIGEEFPLHLNKKQEIKWELKWEFQIKRALPYPSST